MITAIKHAIVSAADPKRAEVYRWFFKTGKGQYGEGDQFLGIVVPKCRSIAKEYHNLSFKEIQTLLHSSIHEERLIALLILVSQFQKGNEKTKEKIFRFYLRSTKWINNWDLVDLSADKIVGAYLLPCKQERSVLTELARSSSLWKRRIAIVSTFAFIREKQYTDTINIAKLLLRDSHDLIHKAVGWMLREMGKRDIATLVQFLQPRYKIMPRTMLRYAIEKFPEEARKAYLRGEV